MAFDTSDMDVESGMTAAKGSGPAVSPTYVPPAVPLSTAVSQAPPVVSLQPSGSVAAPVSTPLSTPPPTATAVSATAKDQEGIGGSVGQGQIRSAASDELHGLD